MLSSMREHIQKYELGDIESRAIICCETTSMPKKRGLLARFTKAGIEAQRTAIIVTPDLVLWAVSGKDETVVGWAKLEEIEVSDFEASYEQQLVADSGINIFGFLGRSSERSKAFIGLGEELAAQKLRSVLGEAVEKAGGTWKR